MNENPRPQNKSPPKDTLQLVLDHQRWINSAGRYGRQLIQGDTIVFRDCDLDGVDFSKADLAAAHFKRVRLRGCRFFEADLSIALFEGCDLTDVDFCGALLHCTTFDGNIGAARFIGSRQIGVAWSIKDHPRALKEYYDAEGRPSPARSYSQKPAVCILG